MSEKIKEEKYVKSGGKYYVTAEEINKDDELESIQKEIDGLDVWRDKALDEINKNYLRRKEKLNNKKQELSGI